MIQVHYDGTFVLSLPALAGRWSQKPEGTVAKLENPRERVQLVHGCSRPEDAG